jgi:uncharacterized protein (PEP-CTERM system associated)
MRCSSAAIAAQCAVGLTVALSGTAHAQRLQVTPSIDLRVLWSDNIDLQPDQFKQSDFVTTITPGVSFSYNAPRASLVGTVTVPIILYARSEDRGEVLPTATITGNVELVRNFFFVDAEANVTQTYFSPFGSRPAGLENRTANRYTSQSYSVSPYIKGEPTSLISYEVRNDNRWTTASDTDVDAGDIYTNSLNATIDRRPTPFGWGADFNRVYYEFDGAGGDQTTMLGRLRGIWRPSPQLELFVSAGYEYNEFPLTETKGATYGGGVRWRPTDRTTLDASYERRFFGPSYDVVFDHRTPRTVWTARASRNISSYPELIADVPAGVFVPLLLNSILTNRIPDAADRAAFIRDFMNDRGLPFFLPEPLKLYNQQTYLYEYAFGSFGILGVRNSVFFSTFYSETKPLFGRGEIVPPLLEARNDIEQIGAGVSWSYTLSSASSITASLSYDVSRSQEPFDQKTKRTLFDLNWNRTISPKTNVYAGARWQHSDSEEGLLDYTETAVFAGFNYRFR